MSGKKRIEELERRVRELESRPYWPPTIIIQPAPPPAPASPWPVWPGDTTGPWQPYRAIWYVDHSSLPVFTAPTVVIS